MDVIIYILNGSKMECCRSSDMLERTLVLVIRTIWTTVHMTT
jgi:hypothetical protein